MAPPFKGHVISCNKKKKENMLKLTIPYYVTEDVIFTDCPMYCIHMFACLFSFPHLVCNAHMTICYEVTMYLVWEMYMYGNGGEKGEYKVRSKICYGGLYCVENTEESC